MPQSWPSQWTLLFIYFILIVMMSVIILFFNMKIKILTTSMANQTNLNFIWKW